MWQYLIDAFAGPGGGFMYAITAVGAFALAVAAERAFWLARWRPDTPAVIAAIGRGEGEAALAAAGDTPLADVLRAGLAETDPEAAWDAMGAASVEAEEAVRGWTPWLSTVGNLATMLGLLGTVYGLMVAFAALGEVAGTERAARLSEGIATAMATTALGLLVAIPAFAVHAALETRARKLLAAIEVVAGQVVVRARRAR